jgi:Na+/H+-translocating membrane pyrophosphatase
MKKALTSLSFLVGSIMIASAQITVNTGGVSAAGRVNDSAITGLIKSVSGIVGMLVPLFVSLAVAAFFWFLIQFIWKGKDDPKVHEAGIKGMGYSILAIFVMVSIWGIIGLIGNMLGIGQGGGAPIPVVPVLQ